MVVYTNKILQETRHKVSPSEECPVAESIPADVDGPIPAEDKEPDVEVEKDGNSELVEAPGTVEDLELVLESLAFVLDI